MRADDIHARGITTRLTFAISKRQGPHLASGCYRCVQFFLERPLQAGLLLRRHLSLNLHGRKTENAALWGADSRRCVPRLVFNVCDVCVVLPFGGNKPFWTKPDPSHAHIQQVTRRMDLPRRNREEHAAIS